MAGVSGKTYEHATAVLDNAPEEVKQAVRNDELSINAAYEVTKLPQEKQQEVSDRIAQGEKPRHVLSNVKHKNTSTINDMTYWNNLILHAKKLAQNGQHIDTVIQLLHQAISILQASISDTH